MTEETDNPQKPARTYNMDRVLTKMNGDPLQFEAKPMTVGSVLVDVLTGFYQDEKIDGKQKVDRYKLACRLNDGGQQPLTPKEIVLAQQLVEKHFGPLIVGPIFDELEG